MLFAFNASAIESTSYSYTISVDGKWIRTQDTYIPGAIYLKNYDLNLPEDLFLFGADVYIADTANSRIVVYNPENGNTTWFSVNGMSNPTGIYVNSENVYIADFSQKKVFVTDHSGNIKMTLEKPETAIYGSKTEYAPRKVTVDSNGNIYVVSDGTYQGLLQFNREGEFLGFFGANRSKRTVAEMLQDAFFTAEQKKALFNRIPNAMYNTDTDPSSGLIFSITQLDDKNTIKKHNLAGTNILERSGKLTDENNFVDIAVAQNGIFYAVTETGLIYEYAPDGYLISSFGGRSVSNERNGQFTVASAIDVDESNNIYVLDKERGLFQIFYPTEFTTATHKALASLDSGNYTQSCELWSDILKMNGLSLLAHYHLGNALYSLGQYNQAMEHYKIANEKDGYSEAFWEIRNQWLTSQLGRLIVILVLIITLCTAVHLIDKKKEIFTPFRKAYRKFRDSHRFYRDILFMKYTIRHPIDAYYCLKRGQDGSVASATVILLVTFLAFMISMLFKGFIFNPVITENSSAISYALMFFVPLLLFIIGNYMVSSINNGEGSLKNVFIMTAYSFSSYVIFMPLVILLSYILTLNEQFLLNLTQSLTIGYSVICFYIGIKETHNYSVSETVKNILLTVFFIVMAIVVFAILYLLWGQIYEFIYGINSEVSYRVGI